MKISSIPQIYRHLARWREIFSVLSKYGLADWISRLDLEFAKEFFKDAGGEALARQSHESRVRLALNELGPTFIKLGQVLSTRPDLVGVLLATELQHLQDETRADLASYVRGTIESELKQPLEALFDEFDDTPLASASIGQVHVARLKSGERVVVKVRHADIEKKVQVDLDILGGIATLAEQLPEFVNYRPRATVAEFQRTLRRELDLAREGRAMQQFSRHFADDERYCIPHFYAELSTPQVLTMQYLDGTKISDTGKLVCAGTDLCEVARRGADLYLAMIFNLGFYHADPHPGNILVLPGNRIGLLDFGMVGRIDDDLREDLEEMLLAFSQHDAQRLTSTLIRIGKVPSGLDESALGLDVSEFMLHYGSVQLDQFDLSAALTEMVELIRRYHITLPARVAMLIKVFVMLEGTSHLLDPRFKLLDIIAPYQRSMLWRRVSPARRLKKLRRFASEFERFVEVLPRGLVDILQQVQSGKFDVHLDHRGLEPSVNRLVYGMLTSALFLGSTLLLSRQQSPLITLPWVGDFSILGGLGCGVSLVLGLRLLRAIYKSGSLDRR
jgi:ubiquinone biosynthesis protein